MAVGLGPLSTLHPVAGFELGIASAGIKRPGRKDVVVMRCAEGSRIAGVTTTNAFCAAPVLITRERLGGEVRYLLTNTGNANAGTGADGLARARRACARLAGIGRDQLLRLEGLELDGVGSGFGRDVHELHRQVERAVVVHTRFGDDEAGVAGADLAVADSKGLQHAVHPPSTTRFCPVT